MVHVLAGFVLFLVAAFALVPSCAITQKAATITEITVMTPCNAWVWVRSPSGMPVEGATVYGEIGSAATDRAGYACFLLTAPVTVRVNAGSFFLPQDVLLWPSPEPREVRLSWVSRAN